MNFPPYIKNKVTSFTCRRGDETCNVTYEYDLENADDFVKAFETIGKFLGYSEDTLRSYYREFDLADASHDPSLAGDDQD